jgi:hypothetical protein
LHCVALEDNLPEHKHERANPKATTLLQSQHPLEIQPPLPGRAAGNKEELEATWPHNIF